MTSDLLKRAKVIISEIEYATLATCSKKGLPWNSPVYCAYDEHYNFYWASWRENVHSRNIRENPGVFIIIYDSTVPLGTGEGVYLKGKAHELIKDAEIQKAIDIFYGRQKRLSNKARVLLHFTKGLKNPLGTVEALSHLYKRYRKQPRTVPEFKEDYPRRIYKFVPKKCWMNVEGEVNGYYVDKRMEINELLDKPI